MLNKYEAQIVMMCTTLQLRPIGPGNGATCVCMLALEMVIVLPERLIHRVALSNARTRRLDYSHFFLPSGARRP